MLTPFRPRVKKRRGSSTLAPPSITLKTLGLGVRHLDEVIVYRPTLVITTELEDMSISSPLHILASADCLEPAAFFEFVQHSLSIRGRGCLISCPSDLGLPSLVSFLSSSPNESLTWDRSSTCSGRAYSQLFPLTCSRPAQGFFWKPIVQMPFSRSWIVCATLSPPTLTSPASFFPGADHPGTVVPSPPAAHSPAWLRSQLGWERRSEWPNGRRRPALVLRRG